MHLRLPLLALLVVGLLAWPCFAQVPPVNTLEIQAAEKSLPEDVAAVLAMEGLDELVKTVGEFARGAGRPEWAQTAQGVLEGPFTGGIDRTKPLGVCVRVEKDEAIVVGMIPVSDFAAVLKSVTAILGPPGDEQGLKRIGPVLVKHVNGWAYVAQEAAHFRKLPDPAKLLPGLVRKADIAAAVLPQRFPKELRDAATIQLARAAKAEAEEKGQGDRVREMTEILRSQKQLATFITMIEEGRFLGMEISVDSTKKTLKLEGVAAAEKGTDMEKGFAMNAKPTSKFAPLVEPNQAIMLHTLERMVPGTEAENRSAFQIFDNLGEALRDEIIDENLPKAQQDERNALIDEGLKLVKSLVRHNATDGILVANRGGKAFEAIAALRVPDGKAVDGFVRRLGAAISKHPNIKSYTPAAHKHRDAEIHAMVFTTEKSREVNRGIFGTGEPTLLIACTADTLWMSLGPAEPKSLIAAMEKCTGPAQSVPYYRVAINVSPMLAQFAQETKSPDIIKLVEGLRPSESIRGVQSVDNGGVGVARTEIDLPVIGALLQAVENMGGR